MPCSMPFRETRDCVQMKKKVGAFSCLDLGAQKLQIGQNVFVVTQVLC